MEKKLDLSKSVYDLVKEYPEVIDIMKSLGFSEITNKVMLNSVGKIMTIPKGAKMKGVSMIDIVGAFMKAGFTLEGEMPNLHGDEASVKDAPVETAATQVEEPKASPNTETNEEDTVTDSERVEQLKGFLKRLGTGEELGAVRKDFASQFKHVEASEIMKAEQGLMREGTPLEEVQQLCDLHSALFHGSTIHEQMDAEHAKVEAVLEAQEKSQSVVTLIETVGHPLNRLTEENKALDTLIESLKTKVANQSITLEDVNAVRQVSIHYAKKGDLLYPHLKVAYDISGPSMVMWTVDGDIRDTFGRLAKSATFTESWYEDFDAVLTRAQEMIYKEQNILFPLCAENFTAQEWYQIYKDTAQYEEIFGVERVAWTEAELALADSHAPASTTDNTIALIGGSMTLEQLDAMLNTMPMEVTFVDHIGTLELVQDMQFAKEHFGRSK